MTTQPPAPDWYPDPSGKPGRIYWDGEQWHADVPSGPSLGDQPPVQQPAAPSAPVPRSRRRAGLITAVAAVIVALAAASAAGYFLGQHKRESQTASAASGPKAHPVTEAALDGFLLTPDQINTAMGTDTLKVSGTLTALPSSPSAAAPAGSFTVSDPACRPYFIEDGLRGPGLTAVRAQTVNGPQARRKPDGYYATQQMVLLFSSAQNASAYFESRAQHWAACSSRSVSVGNGDSENTQAWTMGPTSNSNGVLSMTRTQTLHPSTYPTSQIYGDALIVANNVIIGVSTVSPEALSGVAVNIAQQIAAKVPTT